MRLFTFCLLLFPTMALFSCASSAPKLSGVVVYGHEVRTVRLCGEQQLFWLHTTPEQNVFLAAEFQRLSKRPYQELYLDFTGRLMNNSPGEFSRAYDGTISLEVIHKLSIEIPDNCNTLRTAL
jgi:hypothetical protein